VLGTLGQSPGKKKRFELTFETVLVALFMERVGQRVPDRRTSNRKGPTAECRPSVTRYETLVVAPFGITLASVTFCWLPLARTY